VPAYYSSQDFTAALRTGFTTAFVHEVASRLPEPLIDYVRLNIVARRSSR